jgi:tRNA-binding protein
MSATARKAEIDPSTFFEVDMRVGRVLDVEAFPEARTPAWKLTVDFGPEVGTLRTSAQVTNYSPEQLRDRLVAGAVNLGRKRIAGFVSEFLVLGAVAEDGTVHLLELPPEATPGSPIA